MTCPRCKGTGSVIAPLAASGYLQTTPWSLSRLPGQKPSYMAEFERPDGGREGFSVTVPTQTFIKAVEDGKSPPRNSVLFAMPCKLCMVKV